MNIRGVGPVVCGLWSRVEPLITAGLLWLQRVSLPALKGSFQGSRADISTVCRRIKAEAAERKNAADKESSQLSRSNHSHDVGASGAEGVNSKRSKSKEESC